MHIAVSMRNFVGLFGVPHRGSAFLISSGDAAPVFNPLLAVFTNGTRRLGSFNL